MLRPYKHCVQIDFCKRSIIRDKIFATKLTKKHEDFMFLREASWLISDNLYYYESFTQVCCLAP